MVKLTEEEIADLEKKAIRFKNSGKRGCDLVILIKKIREKFRPLGNDDLAVQVLLNKCFNTMGY